MLYAYGSDTPLAVEGFFTADIRPVAGNKSIKADVLVVNGAQTSVLGCKTATALGILHIGAVSNINAVHRENTAALTTSLQQEYKTCFEGLGKLKDYRLQLHVDSSVVPVAQPIRRLPFSVRKLVEEKLQQLEQLDVIEKAEGPTPWVSPLMVVHKKGGDIRFCVDMLRVNEAVVRE